MASQYTDTQTVKDLGSMPAEDIDELESRYAGITVRLAKAASGEFDAKLRKRYAAPFQTPYPDALVLAVSREVAYRLWLKRGFNPSSAHNESISKDHDEAQAWLKEAADPQNGLIELPLREEALGPGAVSAGGPFGYAEASPYTWTDRQREAADGER